MVLGMGVPELLIILLVVLIIFGPKNLPKMGTAIGKTVRNVREGMEEGDSSKKDDKKVSESKESDEKAEVETVSADSDDDAQEVATE
ncbi:MAG: twin-arginine translocase TatA/TatE family subunit [Tractidigestivibacter sp.]|jgi:sec-independent protein translocase protein TatA|uniref:twin-arginine translocase TatA/TatE family subunit n=1 Tax=Tractidigestivibacter sp. TaxID=2847320 RepID=UPI003D94E5C1